MSSTPPRRQPPRQAKVVGAAASSVVPHAGRESSSPSPARNHRDTDEYSPVSSHRTSRKRAAVQVQGGRKSKRPQHWVGFYKDPDSDDEIIATTGYPTPSPPPSCSPPSRARVAKRNAQSATKLSSDGQPLIKASPRKSPRKAKVIKDEPIDPDDVIPNWPSLPYQIWCDIFRFAGSRLDDRQSIQWLVKSSLVCRDLCEPALTALYECPPLLKVAMAHKFLSLMKQDPKTTAIKYRQKVVKLKFDVKDTVSRVYRGRHLDLGTLVALLPRLSVIDFSHPTDAPPYEHLEEKIRWSYPAIMFAALEATHLPGPDGQLVQVKEFTSRLKGWRWNRRLMDPEMDFQKIQQLHLTRPFEYLERLSFVNFQLPSFLEVPPKVLKNQYGEPMNESELWAHHCAVKARDSAYLDAWAEAIRAAPYLQHLSIETSAAVGDYFLQLLPTNLRSLELIACWEVTGEDLAKFLMSHGQNLEHLNLHYNMALDLSFLTVLGEACPKLKTLVMDFKNYHHKDFFQDSNPLYEEVMNVAQVPTWPTTLELIELRNMKKWTSEAAEVLFQSIIDSAPNLPALRHIRIRTMLNDMIRNRSELRNKWRGKFKRVFLRKKQDPKPFNSLRSLPPVVSDIITEPESRSSRRSSRIASQHSSKPSSRASSPGKELRGGRVNYREVDTDESDGRYDSDDYYDEEQDEVKGEETLYRQGMCDIVDFRLDNQKEVENALEVDDLPEEEAGENDDDYVN